MIGWFGQWLLRLVCASLLAALAEGMMPAGPVKRVGRIVCALMLLWVMARPLAGAAPSSLAGIVGQLGADTGARRDQLSQQSGQVMKAFIEQQFDAYITDKAAQLGIVCAVRTECVPSPDGAWLPESVAVTGALTADEQAALTGVIASELAVPPDRQSYAGGE